MACGYHSRKTVTTSCRCLLDCSEVVLPLQPTRSLQLFKSASSGALRSCSGVMLAPARNSHSPLTVRVPDRSAVGPGQLPLRPAPWPAGPVGSLVTEAWGDASGVPRLKSRLILWSQLQVEGPARHQRESGVVRVATRTVYLCDECVLD